MLFTKRKADQRLRPRVAAHSNTEEASRAVCVPWGMSNQDRGKWLQEKPIHHVGESQQSSAGRVRSPMATRVKVVPDRRSCSGDLAQHPHKEACAFQPAGNHQERSALGKSRPVPCLECGQLGHGMFSCPRFWNSAGDNIAEKKSLSAGPDSCEIFAVTPSNKKDFPVVSAGGAKQWEMPAVVSSRGHQGELASKSAAEDWFIRQYTQMKMVTPTTAVGKTVFNEMMAGTADFRYKRTGYKTVPDDVRVTPVSGATECVLEGDLSLCSGGSRG